jgi:hypothetical protein
MLINQIGTETEDDIVELDSRRSEPTFDPKNRETMTTLLQASLTPVTRSELLGASVIEPPTPVSTLDTAANHTISEEVSSRIDVA